MVPAVYGWVALVLTVIGGIWLIRTWIRRSASLEAELEREVQARLDDERKGKEHEAVSNVRARDLGSSPGFRVRTVNKRAGGEPPPGPA